MKTILIFLSCTTILVADQRGAEPAKVAWKTLGAAELREHVEQVKNYQDVEALLGPPTSTASNGAWSSVRYKFGSVFTLYFQGEPWSDFAKDNDLRQVASIYLFKNDADGHELVWKLFKTVEKNNTISSDHLANPN